MAPARPAAVLAALSLLAVPALAHVAPARDGSDLRPAAAERTTVAPLQLPRGDATRVPYYDPRDRSVHAGGRVVRAAFPGDVVQLASVQGGWLVVNVRDDAALSTTFRLLRPSGTWKVLATGRRGSLDAVSADGRRFGYQVGTSPRRLLVRRVADGAVTQQRRAPRGGEVVAIGRTRTLVALGTTTHWWTGSGLTKVADRPATGADLTAGRVALLSVRTDRTEVVPVPRGSRRSWTTPRYEAVGGFSGDDARVLSFGHVQEETDAGFTLVRVRGAQSGTVRRAFRVSLDPVAEPRWEGDRTFLALARELRPSGHRVREAWVRCGTGGRCERVSRIFTVDPETLDLRGPGSPWVLAQQRTG